MKAKAVRVAIVLAGMGFFLQRCARLNYNVVAPNAGSFHPKVVVIFPVKMPEGMELEGEVVSNVISDAVTKTGRFDNVIDPATARSQMAASKELQDAVTNYLAKLLMVGVSDKDLSKKIGELYHADTFIVVDVGKYGYMRYGGQNYAEVSFSIKLVDAATGTIIWKAGHASQKKYSLFKPKLENMARDLATFIFKFLPTS